MSKNPETMTLLPHESERISFKKGFLSAWGISSLLTAGGEVAARFLPAMALPITIAARVAATTSSWSINRLLTKPDDGDKLDKTTRAADNIGMQGGISFLLSWGLSAIGIGLETQLSLPILAATIALTGFLQAYDILQHGKESSEAIALRNRTAEGEQINNMSNGEYAKWKAKELGKIFIDRSSMLTMVTSLLGSYAAGRFDAIPNPVSVPVEMAAHLIGYVSDKARGKMSDNWALDLLTAMTTISLSLGVKSTSMLFNESLQARIIFGVLGSIFSGMNRSGRTWVREVVEAPKAVQRMTAAFWNHQAMQHKTLDSTISVNSLLV